MARLSLWLERRFAHMLVAKFTEFAGGTRSWPFDYVDKIADQCRAFFDAVEDFSIRADLVACTLDVAVIHNRFYAMGVFGEMLQSPMGPGEENVLADRLAQEPSVFLERVKGYVKLKKLAPVLRKLFPEDEDFEF